MHYWGVLPPLVLIVSPTTSATLWHRLCIPSVLFACEIWGAITRNEYNMLEVVQHKVAKHLQGLHKRVHNEIVLGLLGWKSIKSIVHKSKLLFIRQLISLDNTFVIKKIFLYQIYSLFLGSETLTGSITTDLITVLEQYDLSVYVRTYIQGGSFPGKREWKTIIKEHIQAHEQQKWRDSLVVKNASRYLGIQPVLL